MGTAVRDGSGRAEVNATGMQTELGKIAHLLSTAEETQTPLQVRLAGVSRVLLLACLGIVIVVAVAGLLRGHGIFEVFLSAVSLAVAAVPEGMPAIVTIALAIGVQRMVAQHVLVRKLPAVETLGCATVICTDKTGTLTTGVMTVREVWGRDERSTTMLESCGRAASDAELKPPTATAVPATRPRWRLSSRRPREALSAPELELPAAPRVQSKTRSTPVRKRMSILRAPTACST